MKRRSNKPTADSSAEQCGGACNMDISELFPPSDERRAQLREKSPILRGLTSKTLTGIIHDRNYVMFLFWISPDGKVKDAGAGHGEPAWHPRKPYLYKESPHYGWLRGRVACAPNGQQIIVFYLSPGEPVQKLLGILKRGLPHFPIPIGDDALITTGEGDPVGTVTEIRHAPWQTTD